MECKTMTVEKLSVHAFDTRAEMGRAAALDAAARIQKIIEKKGEANIVFAAAPSQNELLEQLLQQNIDWTKVRGFHQDEYIGIDAQEPAGFGCFLRRAIFQRAPFRELHFLLCDAHQAEDKCREYTQLLETYPIDLIFLGIGENGHLAFNDPAVADFNDPKKVKVVELDEVCRQQQVNDGCFACLDQVPKQAMSMTMSLIMSVPEAICVVPTARKARAVHSALFGPVTTACPASILRRHPSAALYLDRDSAAQL